MPLTHSQRRYLRELAHPLKPVVMIGNKGITPSLLDELGIALDHHELLKVRISGADRSQRDAQIQTLLKHSGAELVQSIGHIVSLYRVNPEQPRLALPR